MQNCSHLYSLKKNLQQEKNVLKRVSHSLAFDNQTRAFLLKMSNMIILLQFKVYVKKGFVSLKDT